MTNGNFCPTKNHWISNFLILVGLPLKKYDRPVHVVIKKLTTLWCNPGMLYVSDGLSFFLFCAQRSSLHSSINDILKSQVCLTAHLGSVWHNSWILLLLKLGKRKPSIKMFLHTFNLHYFKLVYLSHYILQNERIYLTDYIKATIFIWLM